MSTTAHYLYSLSLCIGRSFIFYFYFIFNFYLHEFLSLVPNRYFFFRNE